MCKNYFNKILAVSIFALTSFFIGCSEKMDSVNINDSINVAISAKSDSNAVSMTNALKYAYARYPKTKGNNVNLQPIVKDNDTLAFILNYGQGWELLSADERYVPILAHGEGEYDINDLNPGQELWLDYELQTIKAMKENQITLKDEYVQDNKKFWSHITTPNSIETKADGDPIQGWELIEIQDMGPLDLTTSGHLLTTNWGQSHPWNQCVPYENGMSVRCAAGCVAVAGAQMLKFLHDTINKPSTFYTQGFCNGYANSPQFSFSSPSAMAWENMANTTSSSASSLYQSALLIGWVGQQVDMSYSLSSSGAVTADLVSVFGSQNIICSYGDYDQNIVWNSLINGMPVIVRARNESEDIGHCWIIDGYIYRKCGIRYIYEFKEHDSPYNEYGDLKYEYEYYYIHKIMMNWGWNSLTEDNANYNLGYSRENEAYWRDPINMQIFNVDKKIIYGFN